VLQMRVRRRKEAWKDTWTLPLRSRRRLPVPAKRPGPRHPLSRRKKEVSAAFLEEAKLSELPKESKEASLVRMGEVRRPLV